MRLRRGRLTWPVVAAAGIVLVGGGTTYAVTRDDGAPNYRTVTAAEGDVDQTLSMAGLVDAARRSDLAFGTDGTVAKVLVAQGDKVKAGQVIAVLETESLDAAVTDAQASLAKAVAQLESDQDAQTSSVEQAASGGGKQPSQPSQPSQPTQPSQPSGSDPKTAALLKRLKAQQQAVLDAQSKASAALAAAADALAAQQAACATAYGNADPTDTPTDDSADDSAGDSADDPTAADAACDTALAQVQADQATVKAAQDDLAKALDALSKTLGAALGSLNEDEARTAASQDTPSQDTPSQDTPSAADNSSGGTITAARLASDQAQIDQARADLISARVARAKATLRSVRTGTVVSLDLAKGDSISTGTAVAVVVGGKAVTLSGTVPETSIGKVKIGQTARVTVPGSSTTAEGTVTAIGMTADTSSGSTAYPVTVTVEDPAIALPTGSRAAVAIVIATAHDVVTLPTSAVTKSGEQAIVRVFTDGTLTRKTVTIGAVGSRSVEITDGLDAGTKVVVADLDQAITGASDQLNNRTGFFGGPGGGPVNFRKDAGENGPSVSFGK